MSTLEVQWYANMIYQDQKAKYDKELSMVEYLASFWNAEAVRKIKDAREEREKHSFMGDEEFEKQLQEESFKDNELIKAIQKINANNLNNNDSKNSGSRYLNRPTSIKQLLEDME